MWTAGETIQSVYMEVFRFTGRFTAGFKPDRQTRYIVSQLIKYQWIHGDCQQTFEEIWAAHQSEHRMELKEFLKEMKRIMKMMRLVLVIIIINIYNCYYIYIC